jgi:hypothetical protein
MKQLTVLQTAATLLEAKFPAAPVAFYYFVSAKV